MASELPADATVEEQDIVAVEKDGQESDDYDTGEESPEEGDGEEDGEGEGDEEEDEEEEGGSKLTHLLLGDHTIDNEYADEEDDGRYTPPDFEKDGLEEIDPPEISENAGIKRAHEEVEVAENGDEAASESDTKKVKV